MYFEKIQTVLRENIIDVQATSTGFIIKGKGDETFKVLSISIGILFFVMAFARPVSSQPLLQLIVWLSILGLIVYSVSYQFTKAPKEIEFVNSKGVLKLSYGLSGKKKMLTSKVREVFYEKNKKGYIEYFIRSKTGKTIKLLRLMANTYNLQNASELTLSLNQLIKKDSSI